jgi:hypothetical protein
MLFPKRKPPYFLLAALLLVLALANLGPVALAASSPGFLTGQPTMLQTKVPGGSVLPILTVGDTLPGGYRYEAIPDGIDFTLNGNGTANVFVSHETSLVPFPYTVTGTTATGLSDFDNAQVSQLKLHQGSAGVLSGKLAITSDANYQRFCSSFIAGEEHGFKHAVFFGNEEATDFVSPPPLLAWPTRSCQQPPGRIGRSPGHGYGEDLRDPRPWPAEPREHRGRAGRLGFDRRPYRR